MWWWSGLQIITKATKPLCRPIIFPQMDKHFMTDRHICTRLRKNKLHELRGVIYFIFYFFPFKCGSLNVQIRNNFKNVIFITCKWCKICKYYVNSMVISKYISKGRKKNAFGIDIWLTLFCCNFKFGQKYSLPNWWTFSKQNH